MEKDLKPRGCTAGLLEEVAGVTGLEPAASGVTGRRSNQLSYTPAVRPCFIEGAPICQAT